MIITQRKIGRWVKDDIRYGIRRDTDQTPEELIIEAESAGYVLDPLDVGAKSLVIARNKKKRDIATQREEAEFGGIIMPDGTEVRSDIKTRLVLMIGVLTAKQNPSFKFKNWKMPTGEFIDMDAAQIIEIYTAIMEFVAECFEKEHQLSDTIDLTTTIEALENISW